MKKTSYLLLLGILTLWGCTTPARIVFFNAPSIEDSRIFFSADTVHAATTALALPNVPTPHCHPSANG
ncbi:MAG: hypothetical protein IPN94_20845 [Sphingobacteriales bacterium]|nr:hypothetical protein [Sphingobacteriales bacterium]